MSDHCGGTKRLAIVGCGSSGLITLKWALEFLPDWDVVAFEASDSLSGCWGHPYDGFTSTSTKFTTQFACFPRYDAKTHADGGRSRKEFFRDGEYGSYLSDFADHFQLRTHVRLQHAVERIHRTAGGQWRLEVQSSQPLVETFDAVVICSGLAETPKPVDADVPQLQGDRLQDALSRNEIHGQTVVVVGGGESAVDFANRLSKPELANQVYLSLHSGIRVSPRYHPVRGVPSDFLRNRLMLSAHPQLRNWLGQVFVESRIRYEDWFRRVFPHGENAGPQSLGKRQAEWALALTRAAKDDLFNMFHNKSDDFLVAVGEGRIQIVGPALDNWYRRFQAFPGQARPDGPQVDVEPDLLVPAIGYRATFDRLVQPQVRLSDFHLGCCHVEYENLFLVGFARPVIGNIPTISEMQARWICCLIAGKNSRPKDIHQANRWERQKLQRRHAWLDQEVVYPVEMFPYCDDLARRMDLRPIPQFLRSPRRWLKSWLQPATTMHYFLDENRVRERCDGAPIWMPWLLILVILLIKPFDWGYRCWDACRALWLGNLFVRDERD